VNEIIVKKDLYTFDENQLEKVIKSLNNDVENVILFGHNAAITNFVNKFGDGFIENVPTSGLVWIKFNCKEWKLLKKGTTQTVLFPRDLKYE
jgi:phosphohistidine phosphatase